MKYPSKSLLYFLYKDQQLSTTQIGKMLSIAQPTVVKYMKKYGIQARKKGAAMRVRALQKAQRKTKEFVLDSLGYPMKYRPGHTRANHQGYVKLHMLVWEEAYGELPNDIVFHHVNGNPEDNRVCNVAAMSNSLHSWFHADARREANTGSNACPKEVLYKFWHQWTFKNSYSVLWFNPLNPKEQKQP